MGLLALMSTENAGNQYEGEAKSFRSAIVAIPDQKAFNEVQKVRKEWDDK